MPLCFSYTEFLGLQLAIVDNFVSSVSCNGFFCTFVSSAEKILFYKEQVFSILHPFSRLALTKSSIFSFFIG